jgi:hypothetical protein
VPAHAHLGVLRQGNEFGHEELVAEVRPQDRAEFAQQPRGRHAAPVVVVVVGEPEDHHQKVPPNVGRFYPFRAEHERFARSLPHFFAFVAN